MPTPPSVLTQCRLEMGLSQRQVAFAMGIDPTGFGRVERGVYTPSKEIANLIFEFYGGIVPLGLIYDATHESFRDWLTAARKRDLRKRAAAITEPA